MRLWDSGNAPTPLHIDCRGEVETMSMNNCNCGYRYRCHLTALIASLLLGVIAAFLRITGILSLTTAFLQAAFIIAVVYLATLMLAMALANRKESCARLCVNLRTVLTGALGTILFALVLLLIDVSATSVIGALLTGVLIFFFTLLFAGTACLIKCLANCREVCPGRSDLV